MPTWDEITPLEEPPPRRGASVTGLFVGVAVTCFVGLSFAANSLSWPFHDVLGFSEQTAIGELHIWQFLTYAFIPPPQLHVFRILIFALLVFFLWRFGTELEAEIGGVSMCAVLLGSVAYGAAAHAIFQTLAGSESSVSGITPVVAAVAVTGARRWPARTIMFLGRFPMRYPTAVLIAIGVLLFFSVIQFHTERTTFFAILGASAAAFAIHQGGIAIDFRAQRRTVEKVERAKEEESELLRKMDELLEKISRTGMDSLSPEEKITLEKASKLMADNKEGSRD